MPPHSRGGNEGTTYVQHKLENEMAKYCVCVQGNVMGEINCSLKFNCTNNAMSKVGWGKDGGRQG